MGATAMRILSYSYVESSKRRECANHKKKKRMGQYACFVVFLAGFAGIMLIAASPASGQDEEAGEWTGELGDGTIITLEDLYERLKEHDRWLSTGGSEGQQIDLKGANLRGTYLLMANLREARMFEADLEGADLWKANLQEADLEGAILFEANLAEANLRRAILFGADLEEADFRKADLQEADLEAANLRGADLRGANLRRAVLFRANLQQASLQGAVLYDADLREAILWKANLQEADLQGFLDGAQLQGADLRRANLQEVFLREAILYEADLRGADLQRAHLEGADLENANLERANLYTAHLQGADLRGANLREADLQQADLTGIVFEPRPRALPNVREIAEARNLSSLRFKDSPLALIELREAFKEAGFRRQEREVTFAIKRWERKLNAGQIESALKYVLFELTCQYGMSPIRLLLILVLLIPIFSVPYMVALRTQGQGGIWRVWATDRVRGVDEGAQEPVRIYSRRLRELWISFYFSLLSAFHFGWRDINVGNWIARIQPREYTLRATGWVRTISGIQSLISVYLLVLWVLTYFGRPFG